MLPEYVDYPFLIAPCFVCFRPHVTCVPNVARVSGLSIPDCPLFCLFSSSRDLCTQCCQSLWIVHSWLPLVLFVFVLTWLVYPMLPESLDCPFLITPSVFSNVYLVFLKEIKAPDGHDSLSYLTPFPFVQGHVYLIWNLACTVRSCKRMRDYFCRG
jgi:hypothetical protein